MSLRLALGTAAAGLLLVCPLLLGAGPTRTIDDGALHLEDTPDVPPELHDTMRAFSLVRSAALTSISPDGARMLVTTRFGDASQLHLVAGPGLDRQQITFADEPVTGGLIPGSDDYWFRKDRGGNEQFQIYRAPLAGGAPVLLTDGASRNPSSSWSYDGKRLVWASNARNGRDMDLWMSGGTAANGALYLERSGDWHPGAWSRDGTRLLVHHEVSASIGEIWLVDVATKATRKLTPDTPSSWDSALFSPDGRRVYLTGDDGGDFSGLWELDLSTGKRVLLTPGFTQDVEGLSLSPDGRVLAFGTNDDGWTKLWLLDTKKRTLKEAPNLPKAVIGGFGFAREAPILGLTLSSPKLGADAYTYDPAKGRLTRWTTSESAGLDRAAFVDPKIIRYPSGKVQVPALYYRPPGPGPFPVVIQVHGGPEGQSRPGLSPLVQALVTRSGIAVIQPNVRGSTGYGRAWHRMDDGMERERAVEDVGALLDWIGAQPELAAGKVGVIGGSYGGYLTLATLTHFPKRIAAGVDVVGIANFVTFLEKTSPYRQDLRRVEYGDERDPAMRTFLEQVSPIRRAGEIESALLVAHGRNDPRVPFAEAEQIVAAVREKGRPVWFVAAADEGHGFAKQKNQLRLLELEVLFFEEKLGRR